MEDTLARVVDLACKCGFSQQERFFYTLRAYKPFAQRATSILGSQILTADHSFLCGRLFYNPLFTTGMSNPHPLTSSLLAAEFALLVLRVYYSARGEIGVPAVRIAWVMNYRRLRLPYLC